MIFVNLQDRCRLQGQKSTVTSRSKLTSAVVTNSGPVTIETRDLHKWAFDICSTTVYYSKYCSMIVRHAAIFAAKPRSNVAVRTYPSSSVVNHKKPRFGLAQFYERVHIQSLHSIVLNNPPITLHDFVEINDAGEFFIGNTKRTESLAIVSARGLDLRRKVYVKPGRRRKPRRRGETVCGRDVLLTKTLASPIVESAKRYYNRNDFPLTRIWKNVLIGCYGSYRGRLMRNINNNADSDDEDTDGEEDDEEAAELDREKKKVEKKVLCWHIFMLVVSFLLLALGLVLLFGFSPYVRHIITTFPGYHNYGHFVNLAHEPKELRFGDLTNTLGILLIVLNAAYIICEVVYVSVLVHRNPFALPMVTLLTGVVVLVEVSMINIYMSPVVAMNDEATFALKDKLVKSYAIYDTNIFSVTYDIIAIWGHCCGIISQYDFQTMLLKYRQGGVPRLLQVPPTCCKESIFINGITAVVECAVRAEEIYPIGCYSMLFNWLLFYCNMYSMVVVVQLLDMVIHVLLYKRRVDIIKRSEMNFDSPVFDSWLSTGAT